MGETGEAIASSCPRCLGLEVSDMDEGVASAALGVREGWSACTRHTVRQQQSPWHLTSFSCFTTKPLLEWGISCYVSRSENFCITTELLATWCLISLLLMSGGATRSALATVHKYHAQMWTFRGQQRRKSAPLGVRSI